MKKIFQFALLTCLMVTMVACTYRYQIHINPLVPVSPSERGAGKMINLKVTDARSSNIIAKWRGGLGFRKFTVNPKTDISEMLYKKISKGLAIIGFQPKKNIQTGSGILRVEILQVKSLYNEKGPRLDIKVRTSLGATCSNKNLKYKKIYSDKKERKKIAPGNLLGEKLVNASLSDTLRKLFADKDLIQCLAR